MTLLKSAKAAGVNINIVNIMTMDYGTDGTQGRAEGTVAIASANGTFNQLKSLYPNLSTAQIWGMIGITPMIGYNDDSAEIFRASDATAGDQFRHAEWRRPAVLLGATARRGRNHQRSRPVQPA